MDPDRWRQISTLYHAALERPAAERSGFLAQACGADSSLCAEVESLLNQPKDSNSALDLTAGPVLAGPDAPHRQMIGRRIGPYLVVSPLGAGGMGEVYRATDGRLGRDVALKVLPPSWSGDSDRIQRFEREARVLASLNHPHVGAIHGVEEANGLYALVLELIEGPTLAEMLATRQLPLREALRIGAEIAEALEAAHDRGIIHRDLKPANIKIRDGSVKVLDFGLARVSRDSSAGDITRSPTLMADRTRQGVLLGTPAYMSPEQARGQVADKRSDIWSFGCVLYEMVAGRQAFAGPTLSDTIAAVLEREPDWAAVPGATPLRVVRLLKQCLEKEPRRRRRDIADVRLELADAGEDEPLVRASPTERARSVSGRDALWYATPALVVGAAIAALSVLALRPAAPVMTPAEPIEVTVLPPLGTYFPLEVGAPWPSISPDGRQLAFVAVSSSGVQQLWIRPLDSATSRPLANSEGAARPFWSPDSRAIGFFADGKIKRVDLPNGTPQVVCDAPYLGGMSASWGAQGTILFAHVGGVFRVPASGGTPELVLRDIAEDGRRDSPQNPSFLPDGRFIYVAQRTTREEHEICVASLDSQLPRCITKLPSPARYAEPGYLLFVRDGTLRLQRFDLETLALSGEPTAVAATFVSADPVYRPPPFSVSPRALAFHPGTGASRLTWVTRSGEVLSTVSEANDTGVAVSRDGRRIVAGRIDRQHAGNVDLWLRGGTAEVWSRFTFDPAAETNPVFSPDGTRVVFARRRGGATGLFIKSIDGLAPEERLVQFPPGVEAAPQDWSSDGKSILYGAYTPATGWDIGVVPVGHGGAPTLLLHTEHGERDGKLSPDMRWIAYDSTESGRREIWIQPMPPNGSRWQVSTTGGFSPRWREDNRELFYSAAGGALMSVPVAAGPTPVLGAPVRLFQTVQVEGGSGFAVSPDGQRFLLTAPPQLADADPITVIVNWRSAIEKR
jgi:serine/threonine protein kinase